MAMIKKKGRINELRLGLRIALSKFPPAHPFEDAVLLFKLLRRGKLS
ncbi:MAG: hypothetical protein M1497_01560 [Nitrospirae bacterium]|nr:hypothetical protein [Nitrospirota bacterium]